LDQWIRCVAVDDHPCLLDGLSVVFRDADDIELVATAPSAEVAVDRVEAHRPDVAILDIRLPGMSGVDVIERLAEVSPATTAVMYSAFGDRRVLTAAIAAGARGYVMKSSPVSDLLRAIRAVAGGQAYVDPALSPTLLMDPASPEAPLPEREREILQLLAEGLRTDEVAGRVGLSAETVKADTKRAVHRLEATGRVHAVANALRRSYIT
jgi:two-component system response regulator DesR